jgi:hypothetical protein
MDKRWSMKETMWHMKHDDALKRTLRMPHNWPNKKPCERTLRNADARFAPSTA